MTPLGLSLSLPPSMMKNGIYNILLAIAFSATLIFQAQAADETGASGLAVPRFATLASDEVNLRTGPGLRYPIRWVMRKEGLPVEIVREFDVWRQVRDKDGDEGWVHKSLLTGRRMVIVDETLATLYKRPSTDSRPVVRLEPGVIARLNKCDGGWCLLTVAGYSGWLERAQIWGVYADEKVE